MFAIIQKPQINSEQLNDNRSISFTNIFKHKSFKMQKQIAISTIRSTEWSDINLEASTYSVSPFELHIKGVRCVSSNTRSQSIYDMRTVKRAPRLYG